MVRCLLKRYGLAKCGGETVGGIGLRSSAGRVRVLLKWGSDVSAKTHHGHTALHRSVCGMHLAVTNTLIKAGADIEAIFSCFKAEGVFLAAYTPLHMASKRGSREGIGGADRCRRERRQFVQKRSDTPVPCDIQQKAEGGQGSPSRKSEPTGSIGRGGRTNLYRGSELTVAFLTVAER